MLINIPDDWAIPPDERERHKKTDKMILFALEQKKITYPAEIVAETGLSRQTVFDRLAYMSKSGMVERVNVINHKPPKELTDRLNELWILGLKGNSIRRMSWYRLKEKEKK